MNKAEEFREIIEKEKGCAAEFPGARMVIPLDIAMELLQYYEISLDMIQCLS